MKIIFLLLMITTTEAATWKKLNSSSGGAIVPENTNCPNGYIGVPALSPYTFRYFCVMKYEAKNDTYDNVVSVAAGAPYTNFTRAVSRAKCQNLGVGYDLISNDQWQTIARNIASVPSNWSLGVVASGELNRGHSDNAPTTALAASTNDALPCTGTGQTCSDTVWDSQRRTHTLSNGNVIWDFAGNVWEWVTNDNTASNGADGAISTMSSADIRQTRYGAASGTICASPSSAPNCGMGSGNFNYSGGAVIRGGDMATSAGVFATALNFSAAMSNATFGFRCIYVP